MEGLEANVINYSSVISSTETVRYDSEYYFKEYTRIENLIKAKNKRFTKFSNFDIFVDSSAFYPSIEPLYGEGSYPFIRVGDVKQFVNYKTCVRLPEEKLVDFPTLKHVKKGDIVLTKGGTIGKAGLITQDSCVSRDIIFINSSTLSEKEYVCLYLYLSSKFVYSQLIRSSSQSVQPHLTITLVKNLDIYIYSDKFKTIVTNLYNLSLSKYQKADNKYDNAENYILSHFALNDWNIPDDNYSIKNFTDSFRINNRLDAEYYQPKYNKLLTHISSFDTDVLENLVYIFKSIEPGSDAYQSEGVPFFRVADLSKYGLSQPEIFLDRDNFDVKGLSPKKDTILLSKDGSVGIAYKVEENIDGITSGAILHLKIKDDRVLPDYLCLVLNSIIVQLQAERDAGGSIIQHWKPDEIKQVIIPILPKPIQKELCGMIQESFSLQRDSKRLLDAAKYAVELAIEEDEDVAESWLESNNFI